MVEEAKAALFCKFVKTVELNNRYEPLILEVKHVFVSDDVLDAKGRINLENIGRVGMEFLVGCNRVK